MTLYCGYRSTHEMAHCTGSTTRIAADAPGTTTRSAHPNGRPTTSLTNLAATECNPGRPLRRAYDLIHGTSAVRERIPDRDGAETGQPRDENDGVRVGAPPRESLNTAEETVSASNLAPAPYAKLDGDDETRELIRGDDVRVPSCAMMVLVSICHHARLYPERRSVALGLNHCDKSPPSAGAACGTSDGTPCIFSEPRRCC